MRKALHSLLLLLQAFGIFPRQFIRAISGFPGYFSDLREFKRQKGRDTTFPINKYFPILTDRYEEGGIMSGHYFHQDLLVARRLFERNPGKHVDIGSRIDGFVAHLAVFREVELLDIRPVTSKVKNISFRQADLMQLPEELKNYCDSVSCLHAIEHFGLGRYGDPIDYLGHEKGIRNIHSMLTPGGMFYFSVPIGPQRIEFNAHRVFSLPYLMNVFNDLFDVVSFSYVDDLGDLHEMVELTHDAQINNFGCSYGCGIFELRKVV